MAISKWYKTNFSNSIILDSESTFHFWIENTTAEAGAEQDLYLMVIPDVINQDLSAINKEEDATTFLNGADIREISRVMKDYTVGSGPWSRSAPTNLYRPTVDRGAGGSSSFPMLSVVGEHRYGQGSNFATNIVTNKNEFYTMLMPAQDGINIGYSFKANVWHTIHPNARTNFRLDYNGSADDNVKLTFVISNKLPTDVDGNSNHYWPARVLFIEGTDSSNPASYPWATYNDGDVVFWVEPTAESVVMYVADGAGSYEEMEYGQWKNNDLAAVDTMMGGLMGIKLLHMYGKFNDISGTVIDFQEAHIQCYQNVETKTSRNVDYWIDKDLHPNSIISESSSYALTRTNPKISGNIKIVTDSSGQIYLESINANEELSNSKFKKREIAADGDFANDLKTVFGTVEPSSLYYVFERDPVYENTKREFSEQYDFFYGAGASLESSKLYDEEFAIFAPLWMRRDLPEYFVIFKNDNPINDSTYSGGDNIDLITESLSNAKIVKTFDLRPGSKLGTYLNNIVNDDRFKESPISVNYDNNELTTWFGASYADGTVSEKGSYMYEFYKKDRPIIEFENEITSGFQENGIISMNLMNLDFKFDDNESDEYSINRYFGLYMNAIELAKFNIYPEGLELIDQTPAPRIGIDGMPYSNTSYVVENDNGVLLPIDYNSDDIGNTVPKVNNIISGRLPILSDVQNPMRFFYVSDSDNQFDRVTDLVRYKDDNNEFDSIKISTTSKDLQKYGGISKMILKNQAVLQSKQSAFIKIDFSNNSNFRSVIKNGEIFEIIPAEYIPGSDKWKIIASGTGLNPGQAWDYPVYDVSKNEWLNTFSPEGTPEDVATAFAICINNFTEALFSAFSDGSSVYIKSYSTGSINNKITFTRFMENGSAIDNVKFFGLNKSLDDIFTPFTTVIPGATFELFNEYTTFSDYKVEIENITTLNVKLYSKDWDGSYVPLFRGKLELNSDDLYEVSNEQFKLVLLEDIDLYSTKDTWELNTTDNSISQNFIGGNDVNKNSAVIAKENVININPETYMQTAKGNYSKLKNWNVQGNDVLYINNVDFENETVEESVTIHLEDPVKQFYTSADKNITGFSVFSPSFGIFSILPIKEFDTDLILSSYSYGPYEELLKYYETLELKGGETVELALNNSYLLESGAGEIYGVDSSGNKFLIPNSIIYPSSNDINVAYNDNNTKQIAFNTYTPSRSFELYDYVNNASVTDAFVSGNLYFPHAMQHETDKYSKLLFSATDDETVTTISNFSYSNDKDLQNFEGFFILQDIIHESDLEELSILKDTNDIARFTYTSVSSEYERLREISTKELATISKVVPYINKWVMKDKDVRDNPYRLNNSLAFGMTNFSPLLDNKQIDPKLHSHEFFYIDSFPIGFDPETLPNHRLYFFDGLDKVVKDEMTWLDLMKSDKGDWFSRYFTVGYPTELYEDDPVPMRNQQRFGIFEKIKDLDITQTIFHGAKIQLENLNGSNDVYDGYKISAVMRLVKPKLYSNESPIEFEIITNKINKTILIVGTLKINDYKISNGIDYTFMYSSKSSLRNSNMLDLTKHVGEWSEQVLLNYPYIDHGNTYGWYANQYNQDTGSTKATGYSSEIMNEYQIGGGVPEFADVKLSFNLEIKSKRKTLARSSIQYDLVSSNPYLYSAVDEIKSINGSLYDMESKYSIRDKTYNGLINTFNKGGYGDITQQYYNLPKDYVSNQIFSIKKMTDYSYSISEGIKLLVYGIPNTLPETSRSIGAIDNLGGFPTSTKYNIDAPYYANEDTNTWYLQGGELFNESILKNFSFGSMVSMIETDSPLVTYTTLGGDGINPKLKFIENDVIYKTNKLSPVLDTDKPAIYKNKEVIGFVYEDKNETDVMYRHRGYFEPKTRNLMYTWVRENETMTTAYNIDFLGTNTQLLPHDNFGISRNMYFNKVADNEILKIASESGYKSLYPYINEIAIDHDDFSLFKTTWDADYFKKYDVINNYQTVNGIEVLKEFKSFFGSKAMNVPNDIYIETFEATDFPKIYVSEAVNPISLDSQKSKAASIANTTSNDVTNKLNINIDVTQRIIDIMIANGATTEFKKLNSNGIINVSDNELIAMTEKYLRLNIVPLYYIEDIKLYAKTYADERIDEIFVYNLTDYEKQFNGYVYDKNCTIEMGSNLQSKITKNLKNEDYRSFTISVNVQRI